ncbi:MAG TPA: hypothetical protein VJR89_43165 [Polyangiales bacterium]|nr:hypothetical protein [Polyangiales bacterium]
MWPALLLAACSCSSDVPTTRQETRYAAPEQRERNQLCSDLGARRVCWRDAEPQLVARELPAGPAPPEGWRCGGAGSERTCEDRYRNASRFSCGTQRCLQARPRLPDDGEWECVELSGIVYCHSRGPFAGLREGPLDLGWSCGPRRGSASGERVCVDLDADRPSGGAAYRCRFELAHGVAARSCVPTRELLAGSACSAAQRCPDGTSCRAGVCLPRRPRPACWLDGDCAAGERCELGTCARPGA